VAHLPPAMSALGPNDPITLVSHDFLAVVYTTAGRHAQAERLLRDKLARVRARFGPADARANSAMSELGTCLIHQEKWAAAETELRPCKAAREKIAPDDWRTSDTRSQLGACLLGQSKYADVEPLVVNGYKELQARESAIPAPPQGCVTQAGERVVRLYEAWGRADQAALWRRKLAQSEKAMTTDQ
jgi:hypothetical protein